MIVDEHLLFAAHQGFIGRTPVAIIAADHCLPIACSIGLERQEVGIHACWEEHHNVEEFFSALNIMNVCRDMNDKDPLVSGLYVYSVDYVIPQQGPVRPVDVSSEDRDNDAQENDDDWEHLQGGNIRRPSAVEMLRLSEGYPPWEGGIVL